MKNIKIESSLRLLESAAKRLDRLADDWNNPDDFINNPTYKNAQFDAGGAIETAVNELDDDAPDELAKIVAEHDASNPYYQSNIFSKAVSRVIYPAVGKSTLKTPPGQSAVYRNDLDEETKAAHIVEQARRELREHAEGCRIIAGMIEVKVQASNGAEEQVQRIAKGVKAALVAKSKTPNEPPQPPPLSDAQAAIMQAMREADAIGYENRIKKEKVMKLTGYKEGSINNPMSALVKSGQLGSKAGANGGYWIKE